METTIPTNNSERRLRVILVDDVDFVLEIFSMALKLGGFDVCCARTGRELLLCLIEAKADAILLDVNLPGEYGVEVARNLAAGYPDTPVAFLTAHTHSESLKSAAKRMAIPVWDKVEMSDFDKLKGSILNLVGTRAQTQKVVGV